MAFTGIPLIPRSSKIGSTLLLSRSRPRVVGKTHSFQFPRAQLVGMPEGYGKKKLESDDHEILLAEMRFSDPAKLPAVIENNLDQLNDDFYQFLEEKISGSSEIEERHTLRALQEAVTDVMKQLIDSIPSDEAKEGTEKDSAPSIDVNAETDIASATYDELIDEIMSARAPSNPKALKAAVNSAYLRIDLRMLERLNERISKGKSDKAALIELRDVISLIMNERVQAAGKSVSMVLSAPNPDEMRKQINDLSRQGKVDDAFILLMQANLEQAKKAKVRPAVHVLSFALDHAQKLKDVQLEPEIRLIRALLRTEDADTRVKILTKGFTPGKSVTFLDGTPTSGMRVDGKKFVAALRRIIEDFGNVDKDFVLRVSKIGEESEAVARKLYNMEDKDVKDLQNEAFHKRSVSVWDLEKLEVQEKVEGKSAAWEGRLGSVPDGFGEDGKMQI